MDLVSNKNLRITPEKYKGRSVLITGGLGFIGSTLARRFAEIDDIEITIIDSLSEGQGGNLHNIAGIEDRINLQIANMGDSWVINHLVGGIDYVFNLAGSVSHIDSMTMPHNDLEHNCSIHLSLLEACRTFNPHTKIVFTSTRQVYGRPVYLPIDEQHRVQPMDINGINKYAAEMYHLLYQRAYGLRTSVIRLTNTYGPRQQLFHNRQGFIAWFIRQAMDNKTIELYGDGKQKRDLNHVEDVVDALLLAGISEEAEGDIFNLGHHQVLSLAEITDELLAITKRGSVLGVPFPTERQLTDIGNCFCSYKKIEQVLGWRPRIDLKEGLKQTVDFYEQNREHYWSLNEDSVSQPYAPLRQVK